MQSNRLVALDRPVAPAALAMLAAALLAGAQPARAQAVNGGNGGNSLGPSQSLQQQAPVVAPAEEHLFGTWGGVRTSLGNLGIAIIADFTSEFAGNVGGGVKQGATFANQLGLEADIDWGTLAGLTGFSTHAVIVNRSGSSDSKLFGDSVNAVQEIYGGGGDVVAHLVYLYGEQSLLGGTLDIAAGRLPILNDFAASTLYCNFMNVSICGNPSTLGAAGLTVYPSSSWGGRARVRPSEQTYVEVGVYEQQRNLFSYPEFRSGFDWTTSQDSGVEIPVEIGWEPKFGARNLPGHYKLGFGWDSSNYPDQYADAAGGAAALSGLPYASRHGRFLAWALADQMLLRHGSGDEDGLILLGAYVRGNPATLAYANQYTAGLLDRGAFAARPQDTLGFLVTYYQISGVLGKAQQLEQEFGLPLSNAATGVQTSETVFEVNYDIHVATGVNFQPELQYVIRPNAQQGIRNATVLGFKTHVNF